MRPKILGILRDGTHRPRPNGCSCQDSTPAWRDKGAWPELPLLQRLFPHHLDHASLPPQVSSQVLLPTQSKGFPTRRGRLSQRAWPGSKAKGPSRPTETVPEGFPGGCLAELHKDLPRMPIRSIQPAPVRVLTHCPCNMKATQCGNSCHSKMSIDKWVASSTTDLPHSRLLLICRQRDPSVCVPTPNNVPQTLLPANPQETRGRQVNAEVTARINGPTARIKATDCP